MTNETMTKLYNKYHCTDEFMEKQSQLINLDKLITKWDRMLEMISLTGNRNRNDIEDQIIEFCADYQRAGFILGLEYALQKFKNE